jgi:WD40 repeat protein
MDDFSQKPKRKRQDGKNPALYLIGGLVIGGLLTALLGAGLFFTGAQHTTAPLPTLLPLQPTSTPLLVEQSVEIQPTIIAHRVFSASLAPDGRYLATIVQEEADTAIYLAELSVPRNLTGTQRYTLHREPGIFNRVILSPAGDKLVVTSEFDNGRTLIFDVQTRALLETLSPYSHAAFSADGTLLALAGNADGLRILDGSTLELISSQQLADPYLGGLAFNNRHQLAVATLNQIQIWNALDLQQAPNLYPSAESNIYDIAFQPDGNWLAVAYDGFVQLINITNSERRHYAFAPFRIHSVAFSADGSWLAAGGGDSGLGDGRLFALRMLQNDTIPPDPNYYDVLEFAGNNHIVTDVTFTPDGLLLSAAWDGSVRLWDVTTGQEISRLQL